MKTATALLLAFAGAALAQAPTLPQCAQSCANSFFSGGGYGNCGNDVACICADKNFIGSIACCLAGTCNSADQSSAVVFAQQLCTAAGVAVPSAVSCVSAATTTSGSATAAATTTSPASGSNTSSASTGATTGSSTAAANTGSSTSAAASVASTSSKPNAGPKPTPMAGLGAIGGIVAAVALL